MSHISLALHRAQHDLSLDWRAAYPDFAEATRLGKSIAADRITVRVTVMVPNPTPGSPRRFSVPIQHPHPAATATPNHAG